MDINTINPRTGKPQSWEIKIKDFSYIRLAEFIDAYSSNWNAIPNLDKLTNALAKIEATTFNGLEFVPLKDEGAKQPAEERNCYSYKGESKYIRSGTPNEPDPDAFVIRKQAIDFIASARGSYYYNPDQTLVKVVRFESWLSTRSMTPGQRDTLKEWFGQQLIDSVTPEVLQAVKGEYKAKLIAHIKEDIPKVMGWLSMLNAFQG